MARINVHVDIAAPLEDVWREAADLPSHAEWMADAESIEFLTDQRAGIGTRMKVATKVGPLRTTDLMEVTEWSEGRSIGVKHSGIVSGAGRFDLAKVAGGTRFSWTEELTFPLYLGGPATAFFAKPVLGWIWKRNLVGLKDRLERG
ncbi:MAG: SRPBCC family protein [Acidimicrobiia bacterium]